MNESMRKLRTALLEADRPYDLPASDRWITYARTAIPMFIDEIDRLRAALEWYADVYNYRENSEEWAAAVEKDRGKYAREALEGK